jgi:hypothetical protein
VESTSVPAEAAGEAQAPEGWATHTSQQCEYSISYPAEMRATEQTPYSQLFSFPSDNPDAGFPNFVYVSVITPEIQDRAQAGAYAAEVYNYDPAATDRLLSMQVGDTASVHQNPGLSGFTYQRLPDAQIGGQAARAYENVQPWEFPAGTKEVRYYASSEGCTYLMGAYMDTTGANQPGAITEDLFHQIVATVQLVP